MRWVNCDGPHLHSDWICAEPLSARMSQVKWLRHISSVISSSIRGSGFLAMDDDMIRRAVLEAVHAHELEPVFDVPEPEATGVEEMRAEIGQHAGALIAPGRIAHQPRRAVAVEHAAGIDRTELAAGDEVAHAHEMRLETVIVSGIANDAIAARQRLECR